jgi:hypothetical protein
MRSLLIVLFVFSSISALADDSCLPWFKNTGAKPGDNTCVVKCSTGLVDMGTFDCPRLCENFCKPIKNECSLEPYWKKLLDADPSPFKRLTGNERQQIESALLKMPNVFKPKSLKAIVKSSMTDPTSPANQASSSDEFLIVFSALFKNGDQIERVIVHEAVHHLLQSDWLKLFENYKKYVKWPKSGSLAVRPGDFVQSDGRDSAEEDFANNIEYYMFATKTLMQISPNIFSWIDQNLASQLKIKKGCYEKK